MNKKEQYIKVSDILNYCNEAAEINKALARKCISSTGLGECDTSSLGGAAYFFQQAKIYDYEIPNMIKELDYEEIDSILDEPIEGLVFSVRTYNCLKRAGIDTVRDLTKLYEFELVKVRNLGKRGFAEVVERLKSYGLGLKTIEGEVK